LKIVELTALHVRLPLRRTIRHASHARSETDNLIVRCVLEDRTAGYGEGVPREYVTGETVETALALLVKSDLPSQFEDCQEYQQAVSLAERIQLAPVPGDERACRGNAARCGVELALLDAYGRHFNRPVSSVVRLLTPTLYEPRLGVHYSGAIMSARGIKLRLAALGFRMYCFSQIKVKVGIAGYDDSKRLRLIRRLLGKKMDIRVDANESWGPDEVVGRINELKPYRISAVEQPVVHEKIGTLAEIRRQIDVPIMLDESLCGSRDAEEAVRQRTCDLFNLRLSKCGGFIPTLRLAQFARQYGIGCQLGCQVGESALLSAAGRHFACSVAGLRYLEGSYDRHLMRETLGREDLTFRRGGWAPALPGPGLGIGVDTEAIKRVTIREVPLLG
jgi:L-Ala-D/L-Glu epimerase